MLLRNSKLLVEIAETGEEYKRSRYDWNGIIKQVTLDSKDTFLSREITPDGGYGLGGMGLCSVFEWRSTELYDEAGIADCFPMLGVGLLKKTTTLPFQFTADYQVIPFSHESSQVNDQEAAFHVLPHLCRGMAVEQFKTIRIEDQTLTISYKLRNVGSRKVDAVEFCHNFFQFNDLEVNCDYRLQFPYTISPSLRRGSLIMERDACRLHEFDKDTSSSAFWIHGGGDLKEHWMRLTHKASKLSVLVEDGFPVASLYSWNNRYAFCPETFCRIILNPGEDISYRRSYTFSSRA